MARHTKDRSGSKSPSSNQVDIRAEKKRKREEEKVNGSRGADAQRDGHGSKRRKSPSSDSGAANDRANAVNGRSQHDRPDSKRHHKHRDQHTSSRRRSRSKSPTRHQETDRESVRHRSPLPRGPRSKRDDKGKARHEVQVETKQVPDTKTAEAVPKKRPKKHQKPDEDEDDVEYVIDDGVDAFRDQSMGFFQFKSTKNTKVPGNSKLYGVRKEKKTEYRQYMNRIGGFNRPLSPSREA